MIEVAEFETVKKYRERVAALIRELIVRRKMSMKSLSLFLGISNVNLSKCYTCIQSMSGPAFFRLLCFFTREFPEKQLQDLFYTSSLFDDEFPKMEF